MNRSKHFRTLFRVLRPDERGPRTTPFASSKPMKDKVLDHVYSGSSSAYKSLLVSCTSELNVALAFGGILSPIAVIDSQELPERSVEYLDKDYLRRACLTDVDATWWRSKRSDEVVVDTSVPIDRLLNVHVLDCQRELCPGYPQDELFFPANEVFLRQKLIARSRLGGANKRLFRVKLGDEAFAARPPRPNVCLDHPLLFGKDLVVQGRHEFAAYCAYRSLMSSLVVPRCAFYTFDLGYSADSDLVPEGKFKWCLLLMEDLQQLSAEKVRRGRSKELASQFFGADLLLGNWGCADGANEEELGKNLVYASRVSDSAVVRVAVDRALGNTYPEDERKKTKAPVAFGESTSNLKISLLQRHKKLYGQLDDALITQNIMKLRLDQPDVIDCLDKCLENVSWPKFSRQADHRISDVVRGRQEHLLSLLPFHYLQSKSKLEPSARDGHAAVSFQDPDVMVIMGGKTKHGPASDVWKLTVPSARWEQLNDLPGEPRFSFSAHAWTSHGSNFIIAFGGGNRRPFPMHNDLLVFDMAENVWHVFDMAENVWHTLNLPEGTSIKGRCRHASTLSGKDGIATMYIIGGHDEKQKRKDVHKIVLRHTKGAIPEVQSCTREQDLSVPVHRAFAWVAKDGRILMAGGLGRSSGLREIQTVCGPSVSSIHTHGSLDVKALDLSGFAAVVDPIDDRLVLLGGGQIKAQDAAEHRRSLGRSMGRAPTQEQPFRMLYLQRTRKPKGREKWVWDMDKKHEQLDQSFRLPVRTSWSACLMNHRILLFGGRHGDEYSSETIVLQLRPSFVSSKEENTELAKVVKCNLDEIQNQYGRVAADEASAAVYSVLGMQHPKSRKP